MVGWLTGTRPQVASEKQECRPSSSGKGQRVVKKDLLIDVAFGARLETSEPGVRSVEKGRKEGRLGDEGCKGAPLIRRYHLSPLIVP
ncbi:hypothetical protein K0M31_010717 [Melipona bicolor]|uniref:Uncharacterized protein n=1 Tax=Melipona bicolor TaxID=60889 RepID=A0AA40KI43_9HYME|nr:hypothetical protein K0M31_010717 [Melipona bicolor]